MYQVMAIMTKPGQIFYNIVLPILVNVMRCQNPQIIDPAQYARFGNGVLEQEQSVYVQAFFPFSAFWTAKFCISPLELT